MSNLFYYTGVIFWLALAIAFVCAVTKFIWDFIGSFFFMLKVLKRTRNYKSNDELHQFTPTYKDKIKFIWDRTIDSATHVDFYSSIGRVWKPWPWLSTKSRKQLEKEIGKNYYPG